MIGGAGSNTIHADAGSYSHDVEASEGLRRDVLDDLPKKVTASHVDTTLNAS
jgi:hypothetical protein